jgi:hypothetical protein
MSKIEVNTVDTQCGTNLTVGSACKSVTVAGNDIRSNAYKAGDGGNLVSQSGTTITLGASGDTVSLASGASQTGFGRTGTVDWDTTAKTAGFTAVSGTGYFVNTTSGAITVTLPASPSAGDIVAVSDYAQTARTNNITVARNSSNIEGDPFDLIIERNGVAITFVYVDGTRGWKVVDSGAESDKAPTGEYIVATGGTETICGDYKIHTFTGPGTFTVCTVGNPIGSDTVDYLVVAGGGGGGALDGGGGGAGGYRESSGVASGRYTASPLGACVSALPVSVQGYPITVGGGGAGTPGVIGAGSNGANSVFSTITSTAGGGGGGHTSPREPGNNGGSGGGGSHGPVGPSGGTGNTPPVSPPQGNNAGAGYQGGGGTNAGGGGGGAGSAGSGSPGPNCSPTKSQGGAGVSSSINGTPTARAGGGGGGMESNAPQTTSNTGGTGGGGAGSDGSGTATTGTTNTGGGGGGGGYQAPAGPGGRGAAGGSGIVIIRYRYQ